MTRTWPVRRFFQTNQETCLSGLFKNHSRSYIVAQSTVYSYYACLLFFAVSMLPSWEGFLAHKKIEPLWPVFWLDYVNQASGVYGILGAQLVTAFISAFYPEKRWARLLAFVGLLEFVAFNNSFGKIGHSQHVWVLTSFLLIFLPNPRDCTKVPRRQNKQAFLTVVWGCQAVLLLTYSMAGLIKILGALYQFVTGQMHAFTPQAMPSHIAERLMQTNSKSMFGPWLIDHPWVAWFFMLCAIYLQFFSFWVAFRPILQRGWALALILFHIGSYLMLTINFPYNILLLALFCFNNPFSQPGQKPFEWVRALPLFGNMIHRIRYHPDLRYQNRST